MQAYPGDTSDLTDTSTVFEEDTLKDQYLIFGLCDEEYGIEIRHITEIVGMQRITTIPNRPDFVKGVINLRGKVIPIMDMRLRFQLPDRAYDDRTCIIVTAIGALPIGLVVDLVNEVCAIPESDVSPPPTINRGGAGVYILGLGKIGEKVKILLDLQKLLYDNELQAIETEAQAAVV